MTALTIGLVLVAVLVLACVIVLLRRSGQHGHGAHPGQSAADLDAQARGHSQRANEGFGPP